MKTSRTMQRALLWLDRRLGTSWERAQLTKAKTAPECEVRLDRLEFTATGVSKEQILEIPQFRGGEDHFVKRKDPKSFLPYRRVASFESDTSIRFLYILHEPSTEWIAPFKITLIARDETGLQPKDVLSVLQFVSGAKLVLVEIAFDFGFRSGVDCEFVRRHGLFGKARRNQVGIWRLWDCWGTRRSAKFVRSYYKPELKIHRLELQLNRKFLCRFRIDDVFDFQRLVSILPVNHIFFAYLDKTKMMKHLRNAGNWGRGLQQILERLDDNQDDLLAQCAVLRQRGAVKNTRRLLIPLATNELVAKALKQWASRWPKKPNRLEMKQ